MTQKSKTKRGRSKPADPAPTLPSQEALAKRAREQAENLEQAVKEADELCPCCVCNDWTCNAGPTIMRPCPAWARKGK